MAYADRVFFLGAGASKQDRFPLTSELRHGIAWAIARDNARFQSLSEHLQYLYNVEASEFEAGEHRWERLKHGHQVERTSSVPNRMPDVTDLLSTLDWMIRDQSSFGPGQHTETAGERSSSRELAFVRDLVVQALCYCLGTYAGLETATTNRAFLQGIEPDDALVTTNWDLLLDAARDERFGSAAEDYGTTGNVVIEGSARDPEGTRPRLLKLHGSLSWRYCRRCQRLVIDPLHHVAGERQQRATCPCRCGFSELIVTPGFVREYRNVHLLTIWREALLALAHASEWTFVGYSLPADDVGIRTLLLKARCMRHDMGHASPRVRIVTGADGRDETLRRYRGILSSAELDPDDFGRFVCRGMRQS